MLPTAKQGPLPAQARPRTSAAVFCALLALGGGCWPGLPLRAEDFRVENKIFRGRANTPASQSTTIFCDGVVYDYLKDPQEVIVLDQAAGRFVLLDTARRVRAEVTTQHVAQFTEEVREVAGTREDPFKKFLAEPKFTTVFDEDENSLTLSSPWMTYRLLLEDPESPEIAAQYQHFSDWYARLNTMINPGSKPPFARLLVNAALAERGATAREVRLTVTPPRTFPPRKITLRSEHRLVREVAGADLDRVAQTRQFMDIFKRISLAEYLRGFPR